MNLACSTRSWCSPLWSGTQRSVITIPKLQRFGGLREQGG